MNALSIAWRIRVDMRAVLAAITVHQSDRAGDAQRDSGARLIGPRRGRELRTKSDIRELLASSNPDGEVAVRTGAPVRSNHKVVDG